MNNRVVITGYGAISSIGNNIQQIYQSLKNGSSGISADQSHVDLNFSSKVSGGLNVNFSELIPKKLLRFMGDGASAAYIAALEAIKMAGLSEEETSDSGLFVGSGGPCTSALIDAADITRQKGTRAVGPFAVVQTMSSTLSANLANIFKILGPSYSISSACASSAHCIAAGFDAIRSGQIKRAIVGGGEQLHWTLSSMFDAMRALSSKYNDKPQSASRPFDKDRDGFVISGGAGIIVLEDYDTAMQRSADVCAEVSGYGATSDGAGQMVAPDPSGAYRAMQNALRDYSGELDYINAHATSTVAGDISESKAIYDLFKSESPYISATKSMTGHALGGAGALEAVYSLIMMKNNFIAPSINIENIDPELPPLPIVMNTAKDAKIRGCLSNSFGFGGTNCSILLTATN